MALNIASIPGMDFINNIDFGAMLNTAFGFITFLGVLLLLSGLIILIVYRRAEKKRYNKKIHFFEEVNTQTVPVEDTLACELTIPNTNVNVFYIKEKDMYLPRGVKRMGKDSYWYAIKNNREIINFTLTNINNETGEAGFNYDHTDMRYAQTNLKELIKRNYRDKSVPWWKEYKDVIATILFIFVMGIALFFLIGKVGSTIDKIPPILEQIKLIGENINQILQNSKQFLNSGVVQA